MGVLLQGNEIACTGWMLPHGARIFLVRDLTRSSVQICEKRVHLLLREAAGEGRHVALASEDGADNLRVGCRRAAGKLAVMEEIVEIGWGRLEGEIVFFVTVLTATLIEMLARGLLRIECGLRAASGEGENESEAEDGL